MVFFDCLSQGRSAAIIINNPICCLFFLTLFYLTNGAAGDVLQLNKENIDGALRESDVVIVNFYADWCRFSQNLKPIYLDASDKLKDKPEVRFAMIDCEAQPELAQKYHVSKYPTIKLFRFGELIKKEYRGQRSVDAISEHVRKQLESPVQSFISPDDLNKRIDQSKRNVIAYFTGVGEAHPGYPQFFKAVSALRDDCSFWVCKAWVRPDGGSDGGIFFRPPNSVENIQYTGSLTDFDYMKKWLADKCVPFIREITFENAEELTEEGIPFLILFRVTGDSQSERLFTDVVTAELADQKGAVNFLMADGKKFAHPLHHLGKNEHDLPLIAIDSFRHIYLFPDFKQLGEKGRLRQFVLDLHSGKLHREFHQGPDPTQPPHVQVQVNNQPDAGAPQPVPAQGRAESKKIFIFSDSKQNYAPADLDQLFQLHGINNDQPTGTAQEAVGGIIGSFLRTLLPEQEQNRLDELLQGVRQRIGLIGNGGGGGTSTSTTQEANADENADEVREETQRNNDNN